MEIVNGSCLIQGYEDYNPRVYDDILSSGNRIFCIAADDNHNRYEVGSRYCDACRGFTMIKAEKLDYKTITDAMMKGNFYSSQKPLIHALWYEDGRIYIECSEADRIYVTTLQRRNNVTFAEEGKSLCEASFGVVPEDGYVRITVVDKEGNRADTNAYFTDEFMK